VLAVAVVFLVMLVIDVNRLPAKQLSARVLVTGIRAYQTFGRQLFPPGQCRFSPTCSSYAEVVIREHGAIEGGWLTVKRLLRCGPWTPKGTKDPPPR
jgi:putative membrane protein insertion efficiency factor